MAESTAVLKKIRLEKTVMQAKEAWGLTNESDTFFTWEINNFEKFKKKVKYWKKSKNPDWIFTITKENKSYTVTISTENYVGEIKCYFYCGSRDYYFNSILTNRIPGEVYKVNFPDRFLYAQQNLNVKENSMILVFEVNTKVEIETLMLRSQKSETIIASCRYCMNVFLTSRKYSLTDFTIYAKDRCLHAHKAILASRSSYFRQYIEENCTNGQRGEMELDTTYEAIYGVLTFVYTGRVFLNSKKHLIKILALSEMLGMSNLEALARRCMKSYKR